MEEEVPSVPDNTRVPDSMSYNLLFQELTTRSVIGRCYEDTLYHVQLTDHLIELIDKLERERILYRQRNVNRLLGQ